MCTAKYQGTMFLPQEPEGSRLLFKGIVGGMGERVCEVSVLIYTTTKESHNEVRQWVPKESYNASHTNFKKNHKNIMAHLPLGNCTPHHKNTVVLRKE